MEQGVNPSEQGQITDQEPTDVERSLADFAEGEGLPEPLQARLLDSEED